MSVISIDVHGMHQGHDSLWLNYYTIITLWWITAVKLWTHATISCL